MGESRMQNASSAVSFQYDVPPSLQAIGGGTPVGAMAGRDAGVAGAIDLPPLIWWSHLERIMLAVDDVGCRDLLD
jgi:hypothetical protein